MTTGQDHMQDDEKRARHRPLKLFLLICLGVGVVATAIAGADIGDKYAGLALPSYMPPAWVFQPVQTALYVVMAVAAWRVWRKTGLKHPALYIFWVQLFINFCWCGPLVRLHQPLFALAGIVILDGTVALTLILFWVKDRIAGALFVPYLIWMGFVTLLETQVWRLNG
jgi:tryptophan-rich sensory protein